MKMVMTKNGWLALPFLLGITAMISIQTCHAFTIVATSVSSMTTTNGNSRLFRHGTSAIKKDASNLVMKQTFTDNSNNEIDAFDEVVMNDNNNDEGEPEKQVVHKSGSPNPEIALNHKASTMIASVSLMLALLFSFNPLPSLAAMTGGRVGGSFSAPTRSSSSMSRPSSSGSYGRGYSSYSYGSRYRTGYYSRPNVLVTPSIVTPSIVSPFPRPLYYGSPGVISYNRGPSFFDFLVLGGIIFAINNMFSSTAFSSDTIAGEPTKTTFWGEGQRSTLGTGTSVLRLSVAMNVADRDNSNSILNVLNNLSNTARTDSRVGIQNLSSQIALEILRRKDSIVSASSDYKHYNTREKAQREFNSLSISERSKFEQETVSKFGGVDYAAKRKTFSPSDGNNNDDATMAVVTMILSIDGDSTKLPKINSISDVADALQKIASDAKVDDCLQSAEILWTPESRAETLSLRNVIADYPELRSV